MLNMLEKTPSAKHRFRIVVLDNMLKVFSQFTSPMSETEQAAALKALREPEYFGIMFPEGIPLVNKKLKPLSFKEFCADALSERLRPDLQAPDAASLDFATDVKGSTVVPLRISIADVRNIIVDRLTEENRLLAMIEGHGPDCALDDKAGWKNLLGRIRTAGIHKNHNDNVRKNARLGLDKALDKALNGAKDKDGKDKWASIWPAGFAPVFRRGDLMHAWIEPNPEGPGDVLGLTFAAKDWTLPDEWFTDDFRNAPDLRLKVLVTVYPDISDDNDDEDTGPVWQMRFMHKIAADKWKSRVLPIADDAACLRFKEFLSVMMEA